MGFDIMRSGGSGAWMAAFGVVLVVVVVVQ